MAQGSLTFNGQVVGIEASVAEAWKRVEAQKYTLKPTLDASRFGIKAVTDDVSKFNNELNRATNRVLSFATAGAVFLTFSRGLKELVSSTINVEQSLARINVNLGQSANGLKQFSSSLFDIARNTGSTFDDVAKAAEELARQGLSAADTLKRVEDASKLARIANISTTDAVTGLTAAINTFNKQGLTSTEIVNKLAAVDTRFAVSSRDLTEAIQRTGSAAQEAGVSFDQLIALVTTAKQTTQLSAQIIGTAFGAIFNRTGKAESLKQLQDLGVVVRDTGNNVLPATQILKNLADAYENAGQASRQLIADQVGGVRNINILKATLHDLVNENGVYANALKTSANASDEAAQKNAQLNKTLQSSLNATGQTIKQLFSNIGNQQLSPLLKGVLDNVESLRRYLSGSTGDKLGEALGDGLLRGISNVLSGPVLVGAIVGLGRAFGQVASAVANDLKGLLNLTSLSDQRAQVQARILKLMEAATAAEASQVASASTLLGQKEAILAISQRITLEEEKSAAAAAARASLFIQGGRITLPGVRGAAGGYLPAIANESRAIAAGVGGASPSARPVVVSNFAFGGGVFGPIVANSDEHIVRNYANGGDAIFNPQMAAAIGLPPGASKIGSAAGGYVPNAADGGSLRSSVEIALNASANAPTTSYQAAIRRVIEQERQLDITFQSIVDRFAARIKDSASTLNANAAIAGLGSPLQQGPAAPSASVLQRNIIANAVRAGLERASGATGNFYQTPTQSSGTAGLASDPRYRIPVNSSPYVSPIGPRQPFSIDSSAYQFPIGPNPRASLFSRLSGKLNHPNSLLAASIGLPLLGGFVPQGQGGTHSGEALGAASGGLQGAGIGAIFGPVGVGVGALIGAFVGAVSKATKSVDEFASGLTDGKTKDALTNLYAFTQGGSGKLAAGSIASFITPENSKQLNLSQLREAAFTEAPTATHAVAKVQAALKVLGLDFEVTAKNVNDVALSIFNGAVLSDANLKKAKAAAEKLKLEDAKAGLGADAFLTRGQGFEAATAFGGINRGIRSQFERAHLTRGAFESLSENGVVSKEALQDNAAYQKAKGLDQSQNALAYLGNLLESRIPGSRFHQGDRYFKDQIGESVKRLGLVGTSVTDDKLTGEQSFYRTAYNNVFKRTENTLSNVGGVLPSQYGSEFGITTGVGSQSISPTSKGGTTVLQEANALLDNAKQVADKIGKSTFEVVLKLDGSYNVISDTLSSAQLKGLAQDLEERTRQHFEPIISDINKQLGELKGKPVPPKAPSSTSNRFGGIGSIAPGIPAN